MPVTPRSIREVRATLPLGIVDPAIDSTDYEVGPPGLRLSPFTELGHGSDTLAPEARQLFRYRLALCCAIAAGPFSFFFVCALTDFIELFSHATVGWTGAGLAGVTVAALVATATYLFRAPDTTERTLRVLEITVFGMMAAFFAYWQFELLTMTPRGGFEGDGHQESAVLAAAVIVHFNWAALMVFHAVLVPNTLMRGAGITAGMVIAAITISAVAAAVHPATRMNAGAVFSISVTLLAAGAGLAVFGTAKTEALRREVLVAHETIRELGQYRLKRKLGHGGMGEVYLAEHHLLKRPCAIKRIHPRYLNNPDQVRRFEREVQATARLRHPNTVEIYDYGRANDGTFYYVMEYLPGLSLEDLVARHGPQPPERVAHILGQVAGALAEAHKQGMVHRDIKPSNIVVVPDGSPHDQVKVVDFGLVHSLSDVPDPDDRITREGLIVGTPEYMSPEQASGGGLDGRSDLFSLGSVAYYLLTGKEVFHRENALKTLMAVVNDSPPPIVSVSPGVPADLRSVVKTCLAKSSADRYPSATALGAAIAACECARGWTAAHAADWWAKNTQAPDTATDLSHLPLQESRGVRTMPGRARGCLLGLAVGDAVGTTVEFAPRGSFPPVTDLTGGGPFRLPAGAWTDDTSMALCLATSLVEQRGFDAADQMRRYLDWRDHGTLSSTGRCFDIGITVSGALERFRNNSNPFAGSTDADSAGNGSLMRLAPVPIYYSNDADAAASWAVESSRTTHAAPECLESCALFARMLVAALAGADKEQILFAHDPSQFQTPKVRAIAAGQYRAKHEKAIRGTGYVIDCLEASAWCFWEGQSYREAVLLAVNLGDDADTTGAVCGQLAGAFYSEAGIPSEWLTKLVMAEQIGELAQRLAGE